VTPQNAFQLAANPLHAAPSHLHAPVAIPTNVDDTNNPNIPWNRKFCPSPPDLAKIDQQIDNSSNETGSKEKHDSSASSAPSSQHKKIVIVSNISPKLSIHHIKTFFSFCGKIERIGLGEGNYIGLSILNATESFGTDMHLNESKLEIKYFTEHAANTASLLDQTQLLGSYIRIRKKSERKLYPLLENEWDEYLHEQQGVEGSVSPATDAAIDWEPIDVDAFCKLIRAHAKLLREGRFDSYANSTHDSLERSLYVGNINSHTTETEFVGIMSACGPIVNFQLAGDTQHTTRFGFVEYMHKEDQQLALQIMNGVALFGLLLKVSTCNKAIGGHASISSEENSRLSQAQSKLQQKLKTHLIARGELVQDGDKSPDQGRQLSPQRTLSPEPVLRGNPQHESSSSSTSAMTTATTRRTSRSPSRGRGLSESLPGRRKMTVSSRSPPPRNPSRSRPGSRPPMSGGRSDPVGGHPPASRGGQSPAPHRSGPLASRRGPPEHYRNRGPPPPHRDGGRISRRGSPPPHQERPYERGVRRSPPRRESNYRDRGGPPPDRGMAPAGNKRPREDSLFSGRPSKRRRSPSSDRGRESRG